MTSGINRSVVFVLAVACLSGWAGLAHAQSTDAKLLQSVMTRLANVKTAEAKFVERKYVKLLAAPVESSGTLSYAAPDRFEKFTAKPIAERMSVKGDTVTLEQVAKKKQQQLFIGQHPALAAIVDGMRGALTGNLGLLQQNFAVTAAGDEKRWKLKLVPSDASQYAYVHTIHVTGRDDFVESIEIVQSDGDRSVMTMTPTSPSPSPSPNQPAASRAGP
jgi:outer membrane lipoprotein-sorting protein